MKTQVLHGWYWMFGWLLLLTLSTACGMSSQTADKDSVTATIPIATASTATRSGSPSPVPTLAVIPVTQSIIAPMPIMPTATPTLTPSEVEHMIWDLLQDNAGCRLPCWWGFTPGETSWATAEAVLQSVASQIGIVGPESHFSAHVYIPVPQEVFPAVLIHSYTVQEGLIEEIQIDSGYVPNYQLIPILKSYGQPSEVWLSTYNRSREGDLPFRVVLLYPEDGIFVAFGVSADQLNEQIVGCPQKNTSAFLVLWSPEQRLTFREVIERTSFRELFYLRLDEATELDTQAFFENLTEESEPGCIETPATLWPSPG